MPVSVKKNHQAPLWLLSYADMATLILCFMVLLTSLSVIDERLKHDVLGSVNKRYMSALVIPLPDDPDAFDLAKIIKGQGEKKTYGRDFSLLKQQVLSDELGDMVFQENRYVQIVSLSHESLFDPGTTTLSDRGKTSLDRLMPFLVQIQYPLLIAGHAAPRMDEEGASYSIADNDEDPVWRISFERAFAVYSYIIASGASEKQLTLEAFGDQRPRFSTKTPEGRLRNRRVDLILDKRNQIVTEGIKKTQPTEKHEKNTHEVDGFIFDLKMPGESEKFGPDFQPQQNFVPDGLSPRFPVGSTPSAAVSLQSVKDICLPAGNRQVSKKEQMTHKTQAALFLKSHQQPSKDLGQGGTGEGYA